MTGTRVATATGRPGVTRSTFIPNTDEDRSAMLLTIGIESFDELIADIPEAYRYPGLEMRPAASEMDLAREIGELASRNAVPGEYACFLGGGAYRHYIPAAARQIATRGEFVTAYTPYQPEVAQGSLQVAFEFQTIVCLLMGMDVANAGMYDGPTALAEAALMACRVTHRDKVVVLDTVGRRNLEVLRAYTERQRIEIVETAAADPAIPSDAACVLVESPNALGVIEDLSAVADYAHAAGALAVASLNPMSLAMFRSPGECGVDIATGEGQALGVPLAFGGPYVGLFSCRDEHKRQMPGRVVGKTADTLGREGYVLTLQTREQHIRRERATSNICTSTQLIALMVAAYVATLGRHGLREVAELCYQKAHYAASQIAAIPGYSLAVDGVFFNEFTVSCPLPPCDINRRLLEHGIIGGLDVSGRIPNGMLLCVTETNSRDEIDRLAAALAGIGADA